MPRSDTVREPETEPVDELAERVGELARRVGASVCVAESLTGGMISTALSRAEGASDWFLGAVVAYSSAVKHAVLGVPPGPVVSAAAASAMARGARDVLGADVAVAATGVGGPGRQDGREPGTVFLAFDGRVGGSDEHRVLRLDLDGEPSEICSTTTAAALRMVVQCLRASATGARGGT